MNIIPLTFDENQIHRTILGGNSQNEKPKMNVSVILLNETGSHLKTQVLENLIECGFETIVSVEPDSDNSSLEETSKKFPCVKFIIPLPFPNNSDSEKNNENKKKYTDGDLINAAMSEIKSDYVLVLKDSLYIQPKFLMENLFERLVQEEIFCIVPRLTNSKKEGFATVFSPRAEKGKFVIDSSSKVSDGIKTLYPFDCIAFYNRKKFIWLGGFDYTIRSGYYQNLDLAVRSWLWGEETKITTKLQFSYLDSKPFENKSLDQQYIKFYLKNELPRIKNNGAKIFHHNFLRFYLNSSCGYFEALKKFNAAKKWVELNSLKFQKDIVSLVKNWEIHDEK